MLREAEAAQRPQVVENAGPAPAHPPQRRHHREHGPEGRRLRRAETCSSTARSSAWERPIRVKAPPQAQVIDALIDHHSGVRRCASPFVGRAASPIIPDGAIADACATTHNGFARYRPDDIYAGNLITALGCIDAGITCVIDNSYNSRSAAHLDAAFRSTIGHSRRPRLGAPQTGEERGGRRISNGCRSGSSRQPTSSSRCGCSRMNRENWALARKLGIRITTESNAAGREFEFFNEKLLRSDNTFNHAQGWPDEVWRRIKDVGATVNVRPRSDAQDNASGRCCRIPEGARPRYAPRLQHRQRSVGVLHVHHAAFNVSTRNGDVSQGQRRRPGICSCPRARGARVRNGRAATPARSASWGGIDARQRGGHRHDPTDDINLCPSNHAPGPWFQRRTCETSIR